MAQTQLNDTNTRSSSKRWLTPLPEKVVQKVFQELLSCAQSVNEAPEGFVQEGRRTVGALRSTDTVKLFWLEDYRKAAEALVTTFPKAVLTRIGFIDEHGKWRLKNRQLLAGLIQGSQFDAVAACSVEEGKWEEYVFAPERETAYILNESTFDSTPINQQLFVAGDLLSAMQISLLGLPVVGMLGKWPLPIEKLIGRRIAVATSPSTSSGRGLSSASWKLRQHGVPFEEEDRGKLEISWILRSAQEELATRKPKFWQATLERFFGSIRKGVLKLGLSSKCEPCKV